MDRLKLTVNIFFLLLLFAGRVAHAEPKSMSYEDLRNSTNLLEKDWETSRKEYSARFKKQLNMLSKKIGELQNTLDNGDPAKRREINDHISAMKSARDEIKQVIHELTATSLVKLGGVQKHFINAKDDTSP